MEAVTADIALRSAAAVGDSEAIRAALDDGACLDSIGLAIVNARAAGIRITQEPLTGTRFVLTNRSEDRRVGTALQFALTCGHATAARELLKFGADPRLTLDGPHLHNTKHATHARTSPLLSAFSTPPGNRTSTNASPTHAPILTATRPSSRTAGVGLRPQPKRNIGGVATPLKPRPPFEDITALQPRLVNGVALMSPKSTTHGDWVEGEHSPTTNGISSAGSNGHSSNGTPVDGMWLCTAVHIANVNQCCADAVKEAAQNREGPVVVPRSSSTSNVRRVQGLAPLRRVPVTTAAPPNRRSSEPARGSAPHGSTRGRTTPQQHNQQASVAQLSHASVDSNAYADASIELEALAMPSAADLRDVVVLPGRRTTTPTPPRGVTPIRTPTPERNMECMRQLTEVRGEVEAFLASHQFYSGTPTTVNTGKDILDWDGDLHKRVQPPQFAFAAPTPTHYDDNEDSHDNDEAIDSKKKTQMWNDAQHNSKPKMGSTNLLGSGQKYFDVEDDDYDFDDASGSDSDTDAPPCFPRTPLSYLSQFSNMASPSSALQILGSLGQIRYEVAAAEMA